MHEQTFHMLFSWLIGCGLTQIYSVFLLVIMASSQQRQARHWNLASWNKEDGWDEWYELAENTMRVQHLEIIGLQEDLRDVKNDLHALTATMNVIASTLPNSASVFS